MATWTFFLLCLFTVASGLVLEVPLGDKATLPCNGSGYGDTSTEKMAITWQTQDQIVAEYSAGEVEIGPGFEDRAQVDIKKFKDGDFMLTVEPTVYNDADIYECVWNRGGKGHAFLGSVQLNVLAPAVLAPLSVVVGQTVTLPCYANIYRQKSQEAISLQWRKGQQKILMLKSGAVTYGSEHQNRSSVSLSRIRQGDLSLTMERARLADAGVYTCSYDLNDHPEVGDPHNVTLTVTAYTDNISLSLGETLLLPFYTENPVRVWFSKAGSGPPVILCSVHNDQNNIVLLDSVTLADEGRYTVWDTETNRTIVDISLSVMGGAPESRNLLLLSLSVVTALTVVIAAI